MAGWQQHWYFNVDEACGLETFMSCNHYHIMHFYHVLTPCAPAAVLLMPHLQGYPQLQSTRTVSSGFVYVQTLFADDYGADFCRGICFVDYCDPTLDYCTIWLLGGFVTWTSRVTSAIDPEWMCSNRKCNWQPWQRWLCVMLMERTPPDK